jgi:carboxymethylenebutenolidase
MLSPESTLAGLGKATGARTSLDEILFQPVSSDSLTGSGGRIHMDNDRIASLIHLYEDGALNRRDVIRKLIGCTGSLTAAMAVLESTGLAQTTTAACAGDVRVAENDPAVYAEMLTLYGSGPLYAYQARPSVDSFTQARPAVLVVHENQGLTSYIKDVTRRIAKAGYVGLAVDLLSRQGGTGQFPTAETAMAAYNRTTQEERRADMLSTLFTIREQPYVIRDKLGAIGFCAGGGNVYDLAINTDQLSAAVVYYGPPPNPVDQVSKITAPLLGIYPELDRGTTGPLSSVLSTLVAGNKRYSLHIYENTNHAFHNDTGPRYDAGAACDAWSKTLVFLNEHLR